jgi:hypothetical protein
MNIICDVYESKLNNKKENKNNIIIICDSMKYFGFFIFITPFFFFISAIMPLFSRFFYIFLQASTTLGSYLIDFFELISSIAASIPRDVYMVCETK